MILIRIINLLNMKGVLGGAAGGAGGEVVTLEGGLKYIGKLVNGVPNG